MRLAANLALRAIDRKAGFTVGTARRIEAGQETLDVEQLSLWLDAVGSNLVLYLSQHLNRDDRRVIGEDQVLMEAFQRHLKVKHRRRALQSLLEGYDADDKQRDTGRK